MLLFFYAACKLPEGNQLRENKQDNLSIIENNLQLKPRLYQTIKLSAAIYYTLFVMQGPSP